MRTVPQYQAALAAGLDGDRMPRPVVQLTSSLRNIGRADEVVELLRAFAPTSRMYGRSVTAYADGLDGRVPGPGPA